MYGANFISFGQTHLQSLLDEYYKSCLLHFDTAESHSVYCSNRRGTDGGGGNNNSFVSLNLQDNLLHLNFTSTLQLRSAFPVEI